MKVLVVVDGHLGRTKDGRIWSSRIYNYDFFARYLGAFDEVRVAIRIHEIDSNEGYPNLCSGPNIEFFPIAEFKGPKQYVTKYFSIKKSMKRYFEGCDCAIFRIPSTVGYQFLHGYQRLKKPYAVEVVVDPWDFAAPGTLKTPLRPLIRWKWTKDLKTACLQANGSSYVTKFALQKRYPSYAKIYGDSTEKFESYYSSVNIPESFFANPKVYDRFTKTLKIIHITNFIGNHVKGHRELIEAVSILKKAHIDVTVDFVGEGNLIEEFKTYADSLGVGEKINFVGKLSTADQVREKLLDSDIFVFPSHAEGLPRVLIEAMAVGLPCIATDVNGIPELLDKEYLVGIGEVDKIAAKIKKFYENPELMKRVSIENIKKAKNYSESVLQSRRIEFYKKLFDLVKSRECENA